MEPPVGTDVVLRWEPPAGAEAHDLKLWKEGETEPPVATEIDLGEPFWDPPDLSPATTYHWKVVAKNSNGNVEGAAWTFRTFLTFHRGDADQNDALELTDAVQILGYLFLGRPTLVPECEDAADSDDNGAIELTDAIRLLSYLFLGTAVIPAPGSTDDPCGPDPTTDDPLGCLSYTPEDC